MTKTTEIFKRKILETDLFAGENMKQAMELFGFKFDDLIDVSEINLTMSITYDKCDAHADFCADLKAAYGGQ